MKKILYWHTQKALVLEKRKMLENVPISKMSPYVCLTQQLPQKSDVLK